MRAPHLAEPYHLYPIEYEVAKLFNGERTIEQVRQKAHIVGYPVNDEQVLRFLDELVEVGLVVHRLPKRVTVPIKASKHIPLPPDMDESYEKTVPITASKHIPLPSDLDEDFEEDIFATPPEEEKALVNVNSEILADPEIADDSNWLVPKEEHVSPQTQQFLEIAKAVSSQGDFESARYYLMAALEHDPKSHSVKAFLMTLGPANNNDKENNSSQDPHTLVVSQHIDTALTPVEQSPQALARQGQDNSEEVSLVAAPETGLQESNIDALGMDEARPSQADLVAEVHKNRRWRKRLQLLTYLGIFASIALIANFIPWTYQVQADLEVQHSDFRSIESPMSGEVSKVHVVDGDEIKKGDVLIELKNPELEYQFKMVQARYDEERARLQELENGKTDLELKNLEESVKIAKGRKSFAAKELARLKKSAGLVPTREIDNAKNNLLLRTAELRQAKADLALAEAGNRNEVIARQRARLNGIEAEINLVKRQIETLHIRSPIDGLVSAPEVHRLVGSFAARGQPLLQVTDGKRATVIMKVKQEDIAYIQNGCKLSFWVSAHAGERFDTTVSAISVSTTPKDQGLGVFLVFAQVDNTQRLLRPGMRGKASIESEQKTLLWVLKEPIARVLRAILFGV